MLLQGLLERHEAAGTDDFLAGSATPTQTATTLGQRLGPWTIEAPLGEGGTASVWRARRSDGRFDAECAIKLLHGQLHGQLHSRSSIERFAREGRLLARLDHPNIARLLDSGVTEDRQPYLALELVEGEPIDRWCDNRRASLETRLGLLADVAEAVAAAHAQLIIHRDLKPSNVLVTAQGQVKLLDFSIARPLEETESELTRTGTHPLTPSWASPEQVRGEPLGTASDIWALGLLLVRLLTGCHASGLPWDSEVQAWLRAATTGHVLRPSQLQAQDPDASNQASLRGLDRNQLQRRLVGELDLIALRALADEAGARYASSQLLADDIRRHLAHEPISAHADTLGYRATKFVRRNRAGVGSATVGLLSLISALGFSAYQAVEASHQRDRANVATQQAQAQTRLAVAAAARAQRELEHSLAGSDFLAALLEQTQAKPFTLDELLQHGERLAEGLFPTQPALRAATQIGLAERLISIGSMNRAMAVLNQAASAAPPDQADLAVQIDSLKSVVQGKLGDHQAAAASQQRVKARVAQASGDTLSLSTRASSAMQRAYVAMFAGQGGTRGAGAVQASPGTAAEEPGRAWRRHHAHAHRACAQRRRRVRPVVGDDGQRRTSDQGRLCARPRHLQCAGAALRPDGPAARRCPPFAGRGGSAAAARRQSQTHRTHAGPGPQGTRAVVDAPERRCPAPGHTGGGPGAPKQQGGRSGHAGPNARAPGRRAGATAGPQRRFTDAGRGPVAAAPGAGRQVPGRERGAQAARLKRTSALRVFWQAPG